MSSTIAQQPPLGKSNRNNRRSGSNNFNSSQKKFNKYHDRSLRKRSKSFSACIAKIKSMHTKPVLPTKFLLGGNINDPLNLNSLQDEEINRAQNAVTPKSSPIPTPPNRRGHVEVIIPRNIHDPLNLMSCTTSVGDGNGGDGEVDYDSQLCSPLKLGGQLLVGGLAGYRLGGGSRKKRVRKRRTTSGCSGTGGALVGGIVGVSEGEAVVPEQEGGSAMVPPVQVEQQRVLAVGGDVKEGDDGKQDVESDVTGTTSSNVPETTTNISSTTNIQIPSQSEEATSTASTKASTTNTESTEVSVPTTIPTCSTSHTTKKEQRNKRKSSDDKDIVGSSKKIKLTDQQYNKKNVDLSLKLPSASNKKDSNQTSNKDPNQPSKKEQRNKRKSSDGEHFSGAKDHLGKKFKFASMDKIVSPVVPQPGAWLKRSTSRTNWQQQRTQLQRSLNKAENLVMPKFRVKDKQYQYGNYNRYYGYRNPQNELDPRLKCFSYYRELFEGKDILDIGCNIGHITLSVARDFGARSVVGIDIDKNLIGIARKNVKHYVSSSNDSPIREEDELNSKCAVVDESSASAKGAKYAAEQKGAKKERTSEFYPISMPILYGPIDVPGFMVEKNKAKEGFPRNVTFVQGNYVLDNDALIATEQPQFDVILCLSITKWIHLNWGDLGIKQAFRRMYAQLRPGGKLILEPQHWASYKNKKKLTETIYKNYNSIELFPEKFTQYLLSSEIGFAKSEILGFPMTHHFKGFQRPIQVYTKSTMFPSERIECSSNSCHDNSNSCSSRVYVPLPATPDLLLDPTLSIASHSHVYAPNACTSSATLLAEPEPTCLPYFLSPRTPQHQLDASATSTSDASTRSNVYTVGSTLLNHRETLGSDPEVEAQEEFDTTVRLVDHSSPMNGVDFDGEDSMDNVVENGQVDQIDGRNDGELDLQNKRDNT